MTNQIYFRLIAGSLGTGMLLAFALLVGLTAGVSGNDAGPDNQPAAMTSADSSTQDPPSIVRTSTGE